MNLNHYRHFAALKEQHKKKQPISFADTGFFLKIISKSPTAAANFTLEEMAGQYMAQRHVISTLARLQNINALNYQVNGSKVTVTFNNIFYAN